MGWNVNGTSLVYSDATPGNRVNITVNRSVVSVNGLPISGVTRTRLAELQNDSSLRGLLRSRGFNAAGQSPIPAATFSAWQNALRETTAQPAPAARPTTPTTRPAAAPSPPQREPPPARPRTSEPARVPSPEPTQTTQPTSQDPIAVLVANWNRLGSSDRIAAINNTIFWGEGFSNTFDGPLAVEYNTLRSALESTGRRGRLTSPQLEGVNSTMIRMFLRTCLHITVQTPLAVTPRPITPPTPQPNVDRGIDFLNANGNFFNRILTSILEQNPRITNPIDLMRTAAGVAATDVFITSPTMQTRVMQRFPEIVLRMFQERDTQGTLGHGFFTWIRETRNRAQTELLTSTNYDEST